jgi:Carboxypeptidase regulatory-like domain/TonB dependent receptor-like, beta-barrel
MEIKRVGRRVCAAIIPILSLLASVVLAQTAGGTILGKVADPSGAILPGVAITIKNTATGIMRSVLTNESGAYSAANLQPGTYEVLAELPSFATGRRTGVNLNVGNEVVIDFALQIEGVGEKVDVTTQDSKIDLVAATVSRTVEGSTIRELPLNGRDWTQLATLEPGISSIGNGGGASRDGSGVKLTVSGARPTENNFRLDGISLNDSSNTTPGSILGTNMGVEAVREFSVVSNNYSAEYGRATGAVVNAVTKSGTNEMHGSLFYFGRNSALDGRNFFDGSVKPSFRRHQFGASAGGPIVKNRTFWFGNFEGINQFLANTSITNTLSANARLGLLSTGTVSVDPAIARVFPLMPLPNGPLLGAGDTGQFIAQQDAPSRGRYYLGKIDHQFSNAGSLSGSFFVDDAKSSSPDGFHNKRTANTSKKVMASTEYTRIISPTVLSVSRIGFSRSATRSGVITDVYNPLLEDQSLGFVPGQNIGAISVPGISFSGNGPGATNVNELVFNSFQGHQNLYITKGAHSLKMGDSVERMQYNCDIPNLNGGSFSFGSLPDFLRNRPSSFGALYPGSDTRRGLRQTLLSGYIQDTYRLKQNFSVDFGVRYEFLTIPTEVNGKIALLHNLTDPTVKIGGPVHDRNPTVRNFSPRVGLVWDPFKDGKTSIRSSFGIFDSLPLLWLYDTPLTRSTPFFVQGVTTAPPSGSFPKQAFTLLQVTNLRTAYVDVNPGRSYSMKWNLDIQRQIAGWVAEIGYTGARGVHLPQVERNMNVVMPVRTPSGWVVPANTQKLNPNFSTINTTDTWNADSYYHGLQSSLKKTFAKGLHIQESYAWSKSIDDSSSTGSTAAGSGYSSAVGVVTPLLPFLNRGPSDFDIPHNFTSSVVWELPFARSLKGIPGIILSGWQVGSIYKGQSGTPFSVALNSDRAGTQTDTTGGQLGQRPNLVLSDACRTPTNSDPNAWIKTECFTFPAQGTLGNVGRNTLRKAGISNLDFSLSKTFKPAESVATVFRVELFNALNHTNFAAPNYVVFDNQGRILAAAGRITSTTTQARQVQFALKVNF